MSLLALTRRDAESILLHCADGTSIRVTFYDLRRGHARVAVEAPRSVKILRAELAEREQGDEAA